jgi:hypothetical protein
VKPVIFITSEIDIGGSILREHFIVSGPRESTFASEKDMED